MHSSQKWIGTSWKMNKTLGQAQSFAEKLAGSLPVDPKIQPFVIPPFTVARQVKQVLAQTSVLVGAQNMHWADEGAWTGEISAPMLVDCGLDLVELGHSERRVHFGETDETVGKKVEAAVRHGLIPLICVGETFHEREAGQAEKVLSEQVNGALDRLTGAQRACPLLFAYEPVWAIGEGGNPASADYADARHAQIIAIAQSVVGSNVPCLYGGSVNAENCQELIAQPNIDGLFIGRAAWDVSGYLGILKRCANRI